MSVCVLALRAKFVPRDEGEEGKCISRKEQFPSTAMALVLRPRVEGEPVPKVRGLCLSLSHSRASRAADFGDDSFGRISPQIDSPPV